MNDRVVYVPNKGPHDYSSAEKYGRLEFCTFGSIDRFDVAEMYRELEDAMRDSREDDYILLTSLASLCAVACSIFVAKHQKLNLLIHGGKEYVLRELDFRELSNVSSS